MFNNSTQAKAGAGNFGACCKSSCSRLLVCMFCILSFTSCESNKPPTPLTIVVGSWYGFYPLYYAIEQGLDHKHQLRLKILEPSNIFNLRRSYLRDEVDAAATSMLEFSNANILSNQALSPVIITDFSAGGDVIVAHKSLKNADALRGKRIAVPSQGIGSYFMSLTFEDSDPFKYFTQIIIPETECEQAFQHEQIDACVTYPPLSTHLLANDNLHLVTSSEAFPNQIFDLLWAKPHVGADTKAKLVNMWLEAIDVIKKDPENFYQFVAAIANVPKETVSEAMDGIILVDSDINRRLHKDGMALSASLVNACKVAKHDKCETFKTLFNEVYAGSKQVSQ
ncbi:ABC transporter substrate-binding protein [Glaciecola siphonariae]|uniref:ABC transporter substrate-binding protein n=1 Tax=Glaciecola siphonariae TaxID=521012 RepID=A0ABV9LTR2_9ALTE